MALGPLRTADTSPSSLAHQYNHERSALIRLRRRGMVLSEPLQVVRLFFWPKQAEPCPACIDKKLFMMVRGRTPHDLCLQWEHILRAQEPRILDQDAAIDGRQAFPAL